MALPFTGIILKDYLRENQYVKEAELPGKGTSLVLDYHGNHPFEFDLGFRRPVGENTNNTIYLNILLQTAVNDLIQHQHFQQAEAGALRGTIDDAAQELHRELIRKLEEQGVTLPADYRIAVSSDYNPQTAEKGLYQGRTVRRLQITFPTQRTGKKAGDNQWELLNAAAEVAADYLVKLAIKYIDTITAKEFRQRLDFE